MIEANPRASRTVPFVSKATGVSLAHAATRVMMGETIEQLKAEGTLPQMDARLLDLESPIAVKEAVLPFKRFVTAQGTVVDTVLGEALDRRGHGHRHDVPNSLCQGRARGLRRSAHREPSSSRCRTEIRLR